MNDLKPNISFFPRSFIAPGSLFSISPLLCPRVLFRLGLAKLEVRIFAVGKLLNDFYLLVCGFDLFEDCLPYVHDQRVRRFPVRPQNYRTSHTSCKVHPRTLAQERRRQPVAIVDFCPHCMLSRGHRVRGPVAGPAEKGRSEPGWDRLLGGAGRFLVPLRGFWQTPSPVPAASPRLSG